MVLIPEPGRGRVHGTMGSTYPWLVTSFLTFLFALNYVDRQVINLLVGPIRAHLRITDTEFSYLTGIAFFSLYILSTIPIGWLVDRWDRRKLIATGVTFWSVMTAVCGFANTYRTLFFARVGVGIGEATLTPAAYSLITDYFTRDRLARALALFAIGIPLGNGLALAVGGWLIGAFEALGTVTVPSLGEFVPWQMVFLAVGLPGVVIGLMTLLIVREPPRLELDRQRAAAKAPTIRETFSYINRNRRIYGALTAGAAFAGAISVGATAWFPAMFQRVHGFSTQDSGVFLGAATVVMGIAGSLSAGYLADRAIRRGRADGHFRVALGYVAGLVVCAVIAGIAPTRAMAMIFATLTLFFAFNVVAPVAAAFQLVTPNRMRGKVSALYLTIASFVSTAVAPTAIAATTDFIFGDDHAVGLSIAVVSAGFGVLGMMSFALGRREILGFTARRQAGTEAVGEGVLP